MSGMTVEDRSNAPRENISDASPVQLFGLLLIVVSAAVVIVGCLSTWASLVVINTPVFTLKGTELDRGMIALVLSVALMAFAMANWRGLLPDRPFAAAASVCVVLLILISVVSVAFVPDDFDREFLGERVSHIRVESGAYLTLTGAVGALVGLGVSYLAGRSRLKDG
jgi:hypothetical protein